MLPDHEKSLMIYYYKRKVLVGREGEGRGEGRGRGGVVGGKPDSGGIGETGRSARGGDIHVWYNYE